MKTTKEGQGVRHLQDLLRFKKKIVSKRDSNRK